MPESILSPTDLQALYTTLKLATVSVIFLLSIGTPIAFWLATTTVKYRAWIDALVNLPLVLPPTVLGFYLLIFLGKQGPFGFLNEHTGFPIPAFSFSGLVIGSVIYSLPFVIQPLRNAFSMIEKKYTDAAYTLRATRLDTFFSVIVPMAAPGFVSAAVLGFAHTIGEFGVILMIGGNIPGETKVVSIAIYEYAESLEYTGAHVLSGILLGASFFMLLAVYTFNRRFSFMYS